MTNTRTKLTILILMLTLSFSVFAKGDGEGSGEVIENEAGESELTVVRSSRFGKAIYNFQGFDQDEQVNFVIIKVGSSYYDQNGNLLDNQDQFEETFGSLQIGDTNNIVLGTEDSITGTGQVLVDETLFEDIKIDREVEVAIDSTIERVELEVWTVSTSGSVYHIDTAVTPNFFNGEEEFFDLLFTANSTLSYDEKVIYFLSTFFTTENTNQEGVVISVSATPERASFISSACSLFPNIEILNIPGLDLINSNISGVYGELVKNRNRFKVGFADHFVLDKEKIKSKDEDKYLGREATLPYLDIKNESFDSIYGNSNPYIAIYLDYISKESESKKSKPILSFLINKRINQNSSDEVKFDYNQFRQVTPNEGIKIAEAALRYMTWGVEYTPGVTSGLENNHSDNKVYADNYSNILDWTKDNELNDDYRSLNYFTGAINSFSLPGNVGSDTPLGEIYEKGLITSPFTNSQGNPIAFAPYGIDTPKTFNYKLLQQNKARKWLMDRNLGDVYTRDNFPGITNNIVNTTLTTRPFFDGYVDEIDLYREAGENISLGIDMVYDNPLPNLTFEYKVIKPFLPGLQTDSTDKYQESVNSLYHPNKVAGVDSLGLLLGALSMSEIDGHFLNVFNSKIDSKLDEYNRSHPEFHVTEDNNILNKPYRISNSDIERSTILLPDLSMARPGDILVSFASEEPEVGVVISADFTSLNASSSVEDFMKNIIVVSIQSGFRMANVGVWMNDSGVFGGFTHPGDEKNYHLRRLIVKPKTETTEESYVKDSLEPFDAQITELGVELNITKINGEENPWIPNTGQLKTFDSIKIKGSYVDSDDPNDLSSFIEKEDIIILPPTDTHYFDITAAEPHANIYRNKGKGLKFYAIHDEGNIHLVSFERDETIQMANGSSPYKADYNNDIFYDEDDPAKKGLTRDGFELYVENDNLILVLESGERIKKFGVRPFKDNIRTGDDFKLKFALADDLLINGEAKRSLVVYDKKMLWRANLYIEENSDWNDHNSWNAPPTEPGDNNWGRAISDIKNYYGEFGFIKADKSSDDSERKWYGQNEWNIPSEDYEGINGGQLINLLPYTDWANNHQESGVVCYSTGGYDSPFDSNDDLLEQKSALAAWYTANPIANRQELSTWNTTSAPDNNWGYSWDNNLTNDFQNNNINYRFGNANGDFNFDNLTISGEQYNPYTPGFSTMRRYGQDPGSGSLRKYNAIQVSYSIGVDCSGFIQKCSSYSGNEYYNINDLPASRLTWGQNASGALLGPSGLNNSSFTINEDDLNKLVPGDFVYKPGHVALVLEVTNGNEEIGKRIKLIESAFNAGDYKVINTNTYSDYSDYNGFLVKRLR